MTMRQPYLAQSPFSMSFFRTSGYRSTCLDAWDVGMTEISHFMVDQIVAMHATLRIVVQRSTLLF